PFYISCSLVFIPFCGVCSSLLLSFLPSASPSPYLFPLSLHDALPICIQTPLRSSRYWVSRGTGRPVAPLSLPPLIQAVPATSRCAQDSFLVKRARKQAAVMVPAGRPPMLAISANGLSNCSW